MSWLFAHFLNDCLDEYRIVGGDEINAILDAPADILILVYGPYIHIHTELLSLLDPMLFLLQYRVLVVDTLATH
jgi:hypothetical protein